MMIIRAPKRSANLPINGYIKAFESAISSRTADTLERDVSNSSEIGTRNKLKTVWTVDVIPSAIPTVEANTTPVERDKKPSPKLDIIYSKVKTLMITFCNV